MKSVFIVLVFNIAICCKSVPSMGETDYGNYIKYLDLETGSHIAFINIPASDSDHATTLIFLHGGPGACQVNSFGKEAPVEWYKNLAKHQFNIIIYDQVGSGLSGRLSDPSKYTVDRHIKDLECIRLIAGDKPCILIGDSWGSTLATHYMAKYPKNVIKAIFTSPGSIDIRDWNDEYSPVPRFPFGWYDWIESKYGEERLNRYQELDKYMQTDIQKAYIFAGDKEMDQLADEFITSAIFKTCVYNQEFTNSPQFKMEGMGWWASVMTINNLMNIKPIKDTLRNNTTPVMILRGDVDYLHPGIAEQYKLLFSNSMYIKVPKAGHFIWLDQPEIYQQEIEKFLYEE